MGLLTDLLGAEPADGDVTTIIRAAVQEMKGQGAEVIDVTIPGLKELLTELGVFPVLIQDFKFDLNSYLAAHPSAPVRSLEEVLASGKFHPKIERQMRRSQAVESRDTKEYLQEIVKRNTLWQTIMKAMANNRVDVLVYPEIRRKPPIIDEAAKGPYPSACRLSANSGLPAILVPAGFTTDGLPVGVELLGRAWSEPQLVKFAFAYEQATRHRKPPASTPALTRQ
jgi:amidase